MTPRLLVRILLGVAAFVSASQAQDADITTKTGVISGKGGKPDIRWESIYRGKSCIMRVMSEKRASGEFVPYARSFHLGDALVVDSDEDRDGFFETFAVTGKTEGGRRQVEVFRRDRDGTMRAISGEELKKIEEMLDGLERFWREALPPK